MIEDVLTSIKTLLTAHLDDELGRQDGKYGDSIKLESVTNIMIGNDYKPELGLPIVTLEGFSGETEQYLTTKKDVRHTINIGVAVTDTDRDIGKRRLYRTMRAIENVLEIHAPSYNSIIEYLTDGLDYEVPVMDLDENSTEKGGQITATVLERLDAYVATQL